MWPCPKQPHRQQPPVTDIPNAGLSKEMLVFPDGFNEPVEEWRESLAHLSGFISHTLIVRSLPAEANNLPS